MAKIERISKEWIKPSVPTPHGTKCLTMSFIDQLQPPVYTPFVFFYQNEVENSSSTKTTIDHVKKSQLLKVSLAEVLSTYYPLAGRIKEDLFVDCNDSGALFVEARVHSHLTKESIPIDELTEYLPVEPYSSHGIGMNTPILAVQFNSFECGGTAIGVCLSHKLTDFMSLVNFMTSWATKARSKTEEIIVSPDFHLASHVFPPSNEMSPFLNVTPKPETTKFVTKKFVFDKKKITQLKEDASSAVNDPTRVEAVSAYLWKHFIDVSKSKPSDVQIFHAANLRSRMSLPSERFPFGNYSLFTFSLLTSSEKEGHIRDFHHLVVHLRKTFKRINGDYVNYVQSGLPFLSDLGKGLQLLAKEDASNSFFSSWCHYPTYEVDYGWGKPVSVCTVLPRMENYAILMTTRCGEGIEAWVMMLENKIALLPDELLSLATDDIVICPSKNAD